jgi:hypothetical protein
MIDPDLLGAKQQRRLRILEEVAHSHVYIAQVRRRECDAIDLVDRSINWLRESSV